VMRRMIPDGHILKLIDKHVDFSFVRERVRHLYSHTGRPSVDSMHPRQMRSSKPSFVSGVY
jgi:transposase